MTFRHSAFALSMTAALCLFAGCGEDSLPAPEKAIASGKVNLDGKPMQGGVVRFNAEGQAPQELAVTNGTFTGEVFVGRNFVDVVWDKEAGANPMDPSAKIMENAVDAKFSGPATPFQHEVPATGASDLTFDVTSAK